MRYSGGTCVGQSETLREPSVSVCTDAFFGFNGQNYLFKLSGTLELLKRKPELSIICEFPQNETPASHTPTVLLLELDMLYVSIILL